MVSKTIDQAVAFDFDGTMIHGDSVVALVRYALQHKKLSPAGALHAGVCGLLCHWHLMPEMPAKRAGHAFLSRMAKEEREAFLQAFAAQICQKLRPEAVSTMRACQQRGVAVILCSASCACYMRYVAQHLQVDALLCTQADEKGLPVGENCKRAQKVQRIAQYLAAHGADLSVLAAAYGDSAGDVQMLAACREPVLVHPKRALKRAYPKAQCVYWAEP